MVRTKGEAIQECCLLSCFPGLDKPEFLETPEKYMLGNVCTIEWVLPAQLLRNNLNYNLAYRHIL